MGKRFLASVANVELFAKEGGNLVHFASAKTLTDSSIGFTLSMEEVRAGQGGKIYGRFAHSSGMTLSMTDTMFDLNYVKALIGAEENGTAHLMYTEELTAGADPVTLAKTPVSVGSLCGLDSVIAWGHVADCNGEGADLPLVVTGNTVDLSAFTAGAKVCVTYFVADASATLLKVKANFIPAEMVAIMTAQEFAGDASAPETGKPVGELIVKLPRFQLDGQFDLSMAMTSAATISLNGTALAVAGGDCGGEDYYAEIIEKLEGALWTDGLKDIVIDPEHVTVGEAPVIYGIYKNGAIKLLDNDAEGIVYTPALSGGKWDQAGNQKVAIAAAGIEETTTIVSG